MSGIPTEREVKKIQSEYRKAVREYKKENPDFEDFEAIKQIRKNIDADSTYKQYLSHVPKFCLFAELNPDQIIQLRAKQIQSIEPNEKNYFENLMRDFKKFLITKHYKASSINTTLGYVAGLFSNNGYSLDMDRSFFNDISAQSDYVTATEKGFIQPPTNAEVRAVYDIADIESKTMLLFCYQLGFNNVDVVNLTWNNLGVSNWEEEPNDFIINYKGRGKSSERKINIVNPDLKHCLKAIWLREGKPSSGYIFTELKSNNPKSSTKVYEYIKKYSSQVLSGERESNFNPQNLRQSFSMAISEIKDYQAKELLLGHDLPNAQNDYEKNPYPVLEEYKKIFPKLTVNGWIHRAKAEGFDQLNEKLENTKVDLSKTIANLNQQIEEERERFKAYLRAEKDRTHSYRKKNNQLREKVTKLEGLVMKLAKSQGIEV